MTKFASPWRQRKSWSALRRWLTDNLGVRFDASLTMAMVTADNGNGHGRFVESSISMIQERKTRTPIGNSTRSNDRQYSET